MIQLCPSTFYYHPKIPRAVRERQDTELRDAIERIQCEFPQAGYRTVQVYLRRAGVIVGKRRLGRVMKRFSLNATIKRAFVHSTDARHDHRVYPNLLPGRRISRPDRGARL